MGFFQMVNKSKDRQATADLIRTVSRHSLAYMLCAASEMFRHYDFDHLALLLIHAILNANVINVMKNPELDRRFGSVQAVEPDDIKRGVSRAALSRFFDLPIETVRRRADRLKKQGILRETDQGLIVTEANQFKFGNNHELQKTNMLLVRCWCGNSFATWRKPASSCQATSDSGERAHKTQATTEVRQKTRAPEIWLIRRFLPNVVAEEPKPKARLLRNQHRRRTHGWSHTLLGDLALGLWLCFRLFRIGLFCLLQIGRLKLCERVTQLRRGVRGRRGGFRLCGLCLGDLDRLCRHRWVAGIEYHRLRPFPLGMNADDGNLGIRPFRNRGRR